MQSDGASGHRGARPKKADPLGSSGRKQALASATCSLGVRPLGTAR